MDGQSSDNMDAYVSLVSVDAIVFTIWINPEDLQTAIVIQNPNHNPLNPFLTERDQRLVPI
jgi:hypothetical protein